MAFMSSKQSEPAPHRIAAASRPQNAGLKSVIAADMEITGNVKSKGDIEVNGAVVGDIACHGVVVGKDARIQGKVEADSIEVHGQLDGNIRAKSVSLTKSAKVTGEIVHESLSVEAGAFVEAKAERIATRDAGGKVTPLSTASRPAAEKVAS
jgi:cytoskeletal protein CcmA (bactofilin family)